MCPLRLLHTKWGSPLTWSPWQLQEWNTSLKQYHFTTAALSHPLSLSFSHSLCLLFHLYFHGALVFFFLVLYLPLCNLRSFFSSFIHTIPLLFFVFSSFPFSNPCSFFFTLSYQFTVDLSFSLYLSFLLSNLCFFHSFSGPLSPTIYHCYFFCLSPYYQNCY